jgi:hypothetical protein
MAQPNKKAPIKKREFNIQDFKKNLLGEEVSKSADKEMEWIIMPKAYQDALKLPGIPMSRTTVIRGWQDVGKSTLKNCIIASAMNQKILPVIFETEGNFDFQYAKDCGMDIEPVIGMIEEVDELTGETTEKEGIVDWKGDYFLFTNKKICEYCGDNDYSSGTKRKTKRSTPVIEDIGYIINDFIDKQESGELPVPLLFIWDSIGSISSWKTLQSKVGNPMFDAAAISAVFKPIGARISTTKELGTPYSNTFVAINKVWVDNMNSVGGAVSLENSGGKAFGYIMRLGIHVGGVAKSGVKKLKATLKGEEYQYGTLTKISVFKNHLPTPYNITYSGTMCCVHNGIVSEEDLDMYKKKELPNIFKKIQELNSSLSDSDVTTDDITFSEEGSFDE